MQHQPSNDARNADIVMRRLRGESSASVAAYYGISRQRVHQVMARAGADQAITAVLAEKRAEKVAAKRSKIAERHGLSDKDYKTLLASGVKARWKQLRSNCEQRGIPFELTLRQYAGIVGAAATGRRKGQFVLAPINREQGYTVGNVVLRTASSNCRATRSRDSDVPRTAVATGVYLLYPGARRPYVARFGNKVIGHYACPDEAARARAAFVALTASAP